MILNKIVNSRCIDCINLANEYPHCKIGHWSGISYNYDGHYVPFWDNCLDYRYKYSLKQQLIIKNLFKEEHHVIRLF